MIRKLSSLAFLAAAALSVASAAMAGDAPAMADNGALVDSGGMSLYVFDPDPAGGGKSLCNGPCASNWPPLAAAADAKASGDWSIVMRDDGGKQWAYKGKPVYRWVRDQKAGDRTGDGFNGVWHLARP
jgi:predicted lipoprotein with Yx(FWY)xxD motif